MKNTILFVCLAIVSVAQVVYSQDKAKSYSDDESAALLKRVADRYAMYKNIRADFKLLSIQPKMKATDNEAKLTDTIKGSITLKGEKFRISLKGQEIFCDGKNLWTHNVAEKEVQLAFFEENDEVFSPAKIFSFYQNGYSNQMKERKMFNGKKIAIVELSPINKKVSYFKIDAGVDEVTAQFLEAKVYAKNGMRYIYSITQEKVNQPDITDAYFAFDTKKYPGVNVVDVR